VLESRDLPIPGDISNAATWLTAAALQPGSHLIIENVCMNPTRAGILSVLIRMGANLREVFNDRGSFEKMGRIEVYGSKLRGTTILGREVPALYEEIPLIAVAGALAEGRTLIRDASDLRALPVDRISLTVKNLRSMGVNVKERDDGMEITGGKPLKGARIDTEGDPRVAMAFAVAGLFTEAETTIRDSECIDRLYPEFSQTLQYLIAVRHSAGSQIPVMTTAGE
jgi:3-phosphoshikimate 1-carboxyvinyltransferase